MNVGHACLIGGDGAVRRGGARVQGVQQGSTGVGRHPACDAVEDESGARREDGERSMGGGEVDEDQRRLGEGHDRAVLVEEV
jgi:hypothetical protein